MTFSITTLPSNNFGYDRFISATEILGGPFAGKTSLYGR